MPRHLLDTALLRVTQALALEANPAAARARAAVTGDVSDVSLQAAQALRAVCCHATPLLVAPEAVASLAALQEVGCVSEWHGGFEAAHVCVAPLLQVAITVQFDAKQPGGSGGVNLSEEGREHLATGLGRVRRCGGSGVLWSGC